MLDRLGVAGFEHSFFLAAEDHLRRVSRIEEVCGAALGPGFEVAVRFDAAL